ncbi:ThuA domain-containing protein [Leifsonia poae]|uniref:ThuA-like domain-containing protein n=1 Tax=Leifsonia poae TaxID=110933 RepID=A0A9W6HAQ3_9MICO|nr:ThuA domain-containing protein [Leifsonia poae]GLJ76645.1 hypothetical protein GCM10017584_22190 [Leifsonia poae]
MTTRTPTRTAQVVIAGDDVYEDLFTASVELQDILAAAGFVARVRIGTACLAEPLDDDLVVLYRAAGTFTAAERAGLAAAVSRGSGLLAVHSTAFFDDDQELARLIGARFVDHGPLPHESRFGVALAGHPMTSAVEPFELTHEHYRLSLADGVEVLADRVSADGREPLVTAHRFGRGRVCFVQFGHDMRAWAEPGVRAILTEAADWLAPSSIHHTESEDRTA